MKDGRDERLEGLMREARIYFERHHANAAPDAGFAARVAARLVSDPAAALGWAAMRLLPASLILAAALGYVSLRAIRSGEMAPAAGSDDDVIAWVLAGDEGGR